MAYGNKVLWLDVETTGLDAVVNDVIQIAGIIEIDGKVDVEFDFSIQPHNWDNINPKALEVSGTTMDDLLRFEMPHDVKTQLEGLFMRYVDKFDKTDKFVMAGYNVDFDARFMKQFWNKCGDKWWGSFVEYKNYDVYPLFKTYADAAQITVPNHKLVSAAEHFGLSFGDEGAHNALGDIRVTREVGNRIKDIFTMGIACHKVGYTPDTLTSEVIGVATK